MCKLLMRVLVVSTLLCPASPIRNLSSKRWYSKSSGGSRKFRSRSAHPIDLSEDLSLVAQPASSDAVEPKMLEASSKLVFLKAAALVQLAANQTALVANETDKVFMGRDFRSTAGKHHARRAEGVSRILDDVLLQRIGVPLGRGFKHFKSSVIVIGPEPERYILDGGPDGLPIGQGAQAVVYLGYSYSGRHQDRDLKKPPLAIRFSPAPPRNISQIAEIDILTGSEFQHPGLLTALSVFQMQDGIDAKDPLDIEVEAGSLCVVMPCAQGGTLQDEILPRPDGMPKRLTKERFINLIHWFTEIVAGVKVLHDNGYVHGDLKPANILFRNKGPSDPAVADFGVSAECPPGTSKSIGLVGTPGYRPPDMFNELKFSERMDSFALGVILFEMLTGKRLFPGMETHSGITDILLSLVESLPERKKIKAWEETITRSAHVIGPPDQEDLDEAYFFIRECLLGTLRVSSMHEFKLLGGVRSAMAEASPPPAETPRPPRMLTPLTAEVPRSSTPVVPAVPSAKPGVKPSDEVVPVKAPSAKAVRTKASKSGLPPVRTNASAKSGLPPLRVGGKKP